MPGFDGTGPRGFGPMTGGGFGYCTGYPVGRGRGWGNRPFMGYAGRGRGFRSGFYASGPIGWQGANPGYGAVPYATYGQPEVTREEQVNMLKDQSAYFENVLDDLKKQIKEIEGSED
ncbi:MAG: DUF5320 domain-containing protein [Clostridia bacterium]|nr:DUF5320 domain-containing protein [Clostridia bacterium]